MTSCPGTSGSTRLADLLEDVVASHEAGRAAAVAVEDIDAFFNARHLVQMAHALTLPEISILMQISARREEGLALARKGDADGGGRAIRTAREMMAAAALASEASEVAESFQLAAEAFLAFSSRDYVQAEGMLLGALERCRNLRRAYAYPVEVRRIHLARNVARVRSAARDWGRAIRLASDLVCYTEGELERWPFPQVRIEGDVDEVTDGHRGILADQILGEISLALRASGQARLLDLVDQRLFEVPDSLRPPWRKRMRLRLRAMRSSVQGDHEDYLACASAFFRAGAGHMPRAWKEMSEEVLSLGARLASGEVRAAS